MSHVAGRPWDMYRAELADTQRGQHSARVSLPCVYCGELTKSVYRVCCDHTDLLDLDPQAPAALVEPREHALRDELAAELSPPTLGSTSAAHLDATNGEGPSSAALDFLETV